MWYELRMGLKGLLVSFSIIENMYGDNNASSYQKQSKHVSVSNCLFDHFYAVQMKKKWLNKVFEISLVGFTQIIQSIQISTTCTAFNLLTDGLRRENFHFQNF